jgi:hypothetical protein
MTPAATSPPPARTGAIPAVVKTSRRATTTSFCILPPVLQLRDIEEAPATGLGMDRRGSYVRPGRQTGPAQQNRNENWCLSS